MGMQLLRVLAYIISQRVVRILVEISVTYAWDTMKDNIQQSEYSWNFVMLLLKTQILSRHLSP